MLRNAPAFGSAHFAARLGGLQLFLDGRRNVMLAALDFLKNPVALALPLKAAQSLFDALAFPELNKYHLVNSPPLFED